ncbi:hypothetical protein NDU88_007773 [Pleurodeles waltl]|uniref:Uncharacterized protein n=1 Tax=Pleurodeles waltl TaxID=8319 RepID=A0AAV7QSU4_PLEWA|nr:hypothetical protein NDU88_007773 [Pleurodeles waltl]
MMRNIAAAAVNNASPHAVWFLDTVRPDFDTTSLGLENQRKAYPDLRCPSGSTHRSLAGEKKQHTPTRPEEERSTLSFGSEKSTHHWPFPTHTHLCSFILMLPR